MNYLNQARTVMVDVDDTILLWDLDKYPHTEEDVAILERDDKLFRFLPHKKNIEFIWKLKLQGYGIVIWSKAGNEWALKVVNKLGLQSLPDIVMSKPEFAVDDLLDARKIIPSVLWIDPITGDYKRSV